MQDPAILDAQHEAAQDLLPDPTEHVIELTGVNTLNMKATTPEQVTAWLSPNRAVMVERNICPPFSQVKVTTRHATHVLLMRNGTYYFGECDGYEVVVELRGLKGTLKWREKQDV